MLHASEPWLKNLYPVNGVLEPGFFNKGVYEPLSLDSACLKGIPMRRNAQDITPVASGAFATTQAPLRPLPVGSYHTPFLVYPTLWFWDPNSKIRQPKKGVW